MFIRQGIREWYITSTNFWKYVVTFLIKIQKSEGNSTTLKNRIKKLEGKPTTLKNWTFNSIPYILPRNHFIGLILEAHLEFSFENVASKIRCNDLTRFGKDGLRFGHNFM